MFGDVWSEHGGRTRTLLLSDFEQESSKKGFNRLEQDRQDMPGQAETLIRIEKFVDYVMKNDSPAYRFRRRVGVELSETRVGRRVRKTFPLHFLLDSRHTYSEKPAAFLRACWQVCRLYAFEINRPVRDRYDVDARYAEMMNMIVETIRQQAKEGWFRRCMHDRRFQARCNGERAASYVAAVLNQYAKTEIIRLDFGYIGGASAHVTIDRAWSDFEDFLQLLDYHPHFKHLTGYMWSIEQGEDKGYHMHVVFFFNGSEVCQDIVKGRFIGELWEDRVTQGRGNYYNCNQHIDRYSRVGIGTIHRANAEECLNAIRCLQYLSKSGEFLDRDDQYLRIKHKGRMHTFGTGQAPDITMIRRGRPASAAPWLGFGQSWGADMDSVV